MAGTAVFRIVVSSDSMKNATATSHGNSSLLVLTCAVSGADAKSVRGLQLHYHYIKRWGTRILVGMPFLTLFNRQPVSLARFQGCISDDPSS